MTRSADGFSLALAAGVALAYPLASRAAFALPLGLGLGQDAARLLSACALLALALAAYVLPRRLSRGPASCDAGQPGGAGAASAPRLPAWVAGSTVLGVLLALALSPFAHDAVPSASAAYVLASGVVAPAAEELAFRGVVLEGLRPSFGLFGSLALSSTLFALSHGGAGPCAPVLAAGLLLGLVRVSSASTVPSVALHSAANLAAFPLALAGVPAWLSLASAVALLAVVPVFCCRGALLRGCGAPDGRPRE